MLAVSPRDKSTKNTKGAPETETAGRPDEAVNSDVPDDPDQMKK
jgi:hypothetical protein